LAWMEPLKESPIPTPFRVIKPWGTSPSQPNPGQTRSRIMTGGHRGQSGVGREVAGIFEVLTSDLGGGWSAAM
jgi:hypothetical protein